MKRRIIAIILTVILLMTMTPVYGLMAHASRSALEENYAQSYQNIVVISESKLYMNVEVNSTLYVKSGAVLQLYNCVIKGDLVVFGAALLSNVRIEGSLYSSSMFFTNSAPSTFYNGHVYYVGSVSVSQLIALDMNTALNLIPYQIDECYFIDRKLFVKGSILNVVDVYINGVKLNIAEDGTVDQWLDIQPTDEPLNLTFVNGSTRRIEKLTAAEVEKDGNGNVNNLPSITASDSTVCINRKDLVDFKASAYDKEDGNLTTRLQTDFSKVDFAKEGSYEAVLSVTDSNGGTKTKTVTITVADHDYSVTKQEATCTAPGKISYACRICGNQKEESIPALEHDWVLKDSQPATCTMSGTELYKCSKCGDTRTEETPATGHSIVLLPEVQATCTASGLTAGEKCNKCNQVIEAQVIIPATGHTWDMGIETQTPTCGDNGMAMYTCSTCGETKTEVIPATENHKWDDGVVTGYATCVSEGVITYTCAVCKKSKTEYIYKPGSHVWDNGVVTQKATCITEGTRKYTCAACGETKTEPIPLGDHTWNDGVEIKKPTCKTTGEKTYTCTICGVTKTDTLPATGVHTCDSGVITKAATCTTTGIKTHTCIYCKEIITVVIPAKGHNYQLVTNAATTTESGSTTKKCTTCGKVAETVVINPIGSVSLKKKTLTCNGKVRHPGVTVTDSNGNVISKEYYTVKYSKGCSDVGTYKIRVTFKGMYSGKVYRKFKIVPARVTDLDAVSKKAGLATLNWSAVKGAQKYVIYYSLSKTGNYKRLAATKKTTYNIKDLKPGKGYYFIVKAYAKVNDKGYYSAKSNRNGARVK